MDEFRCLLLACQQVVLSEGPDRLMWGLDEGDGFSVVIHAWRVEMKRIPVMIELVKRGFMVSSGICPICEENLESAEHLVVSCQFAQSVWCIISFWCKISPFFAFSVKDLLELHRFYQLPKWKAKALNAVCLTTTWCLWRARNALVHEGKPIYIGAWSVR
ncbi:uncharacterized protein LOC143545881 [Bidens hawaiensis]|uniref:uncharacterized protein LOC143545881 n=1 Tax=Bidens hawaiensis TaxID=980011 RepID=UPI00404ACB3E